MLLFWKLVDETQIPQSQEYTDTFKQNLTCTFLSIRGNLKYTLCHEGPCRYHRQFLAPCWWNLLKKPGVPLKINVHQVFLKVGFSEIFTQNHAFKAIWWLNDDSMKKYFAVFKKKDLYETYWLVFVSVLNEFLKQI